MISRTSISVNVVRPHSTLTRTSANTSLDDSPTKDNEHEIGHSPNGHHHRRSYRIDTFLRLETLFAIILSLSFVPHVVSIQCYSCKATASNEIEANVRCLETANLEDCNDFYNYYSEVEDLSVPSLDYVDLADYSDVTLNTASEKHSHRKSERPEKSSKMISMSISTAGKRTKRELTTAKSTKVKASELEYDYKSIDDYQYPERNKKRRVTTHRPPGGDKSSFAPSITGDKGNQSSSEGISQKGAGLPTDREHYCYSMTRKNAWESYTIEKGCKKIVYCKTHEENLPDWTMPWNFCCDKSRCNAKLVKDKPQRIFAMGCRRTDDCIQGHNTRHVCPEMFQACPKVSMNVVKMECRAKTRLAVSNKNSVGGGYFGQFKEKKCFCAKGFYPRGPICTSGGFSKQVSRTYLLCSVVVVVFLAAIL